MHRLLIRVAIIPFLAAAVSCRPEHTAAPQPDAHARADAAGSHPTDPLYAGRRLSTWIKLLRQGTTAERYWAAWSIGELGADAAPAVPELSRALADRNSDMRTAAACSLRDIGPRPPPPFPPW